MNESIADSNIFSWLSPASGAASSAIGGFLPMPINRPMPFFGSAMLRLQNRVVTQNQLESESAARHRRRDACALEHERHRLRVDERRRGPRVRGRAALRVERLADHA